MYIVILICTTPREPIIFQFYNNRFKNITIIWLDFLFVHLARYILFFLNYVIGYILGVLLNYITIFL